MAQSLLTPPDTVRGMTSLDKSKFVKQISVPVLRISENTIRFFIATLKPYLLKLENFKPVQVNENNAKEKLIFLNPNRASNLCTLSESFRKLSLEFDISEKPIFDRRDLTLTYENWKCHDIIAAILPASLSFSGFSIIGNIIHVNLKDELSPYKRVIGQVLLEKTKICRSVVRKTKNIDNSFRNFEMEVLAGDENLVTEFKENGCKFKLNFAEVYWNPRLHDEHGRILRKLRENDVLYDVFCGVGPFAVPAARIGCHVLANDLNPACCKWLRHNAAANKLSAGQLEVFNEPGDVFIKRDVRADLLNRVADPKYRTSTFHVTMNLPALAYTFLATFVGLFDGDELDKFSPAQLPFVHFYCFMKNKLNPEVEAKSLVEDTLGVRLPDDAVEVLNVRNVAPNKEMIRVSFSMPKEVLSGDSSSTRKGAKRFHNKLCSAETGQSQSGGVMMDLDGNGDVHSLKRAKFF